MKSGTRNWLTYGGLLYASGCLTLALFGNLPEGGFGFWPFALAGLVLVGLAILKSRNWWLLLLLPLVLSPMAELIAYALAGSTGGLRMV